MKGCGEWAVTGFRAHDLQWIWCWKQPLQSMKNLILPGPNDGFSWWIQLQAIHIRHSGSILKLYWHELASKCVIHHLYHTG